MVHAGCVLVAGIRPSRTWMSGSLESVRWNACGHWLDFGLYSHLKEFSGNINSKGKMPSTENILPRGESNPWRCIKQDSEPNTLPTSYSGPSYHHLTPFLAVVGWFPEESTGPTRGVMVRASAVLASACHECYIAGSTLGRDFDILALVCGIY